MKLSWKSSYFYPYTCEKVFSTVISHDNVKPSEYNFEELSETAFEAEKEAAFSEGRFLVKVTEMKPYEKCAYILYTKNFDILWSAEFKAVKDECKMTLTETYLFHKGKFLQYILALLFIKQQDAQNDFFKEILYKLNHPEV